jgi:hypothetical protein
MSTIRVDNFGPSAGGTTYSARFLPNKYTAWYVAIVDRALSEGRKKGQGVYYERHHIVPRFMGGEDAGNTVLLTAKEHFIAHLLLTKMLDGQWKTSAAFALAKMAFQDSNQQNRYNARTFAVVRELVGRAFSEIKAGSTPWCKGLTVETSETLRRAAEKRKKTLAQNPYRATDETKAKISVSSRRPRKPLSDDHKAKLSAAKTGVSVGPHSEKTKQKQRGVEYYDPKTLKTKRFKTHLGEAVPNGWIRGRYVKHSYVWATDGIHNVKCLAADIPSGYRGGRTVEGGLACR